MLNKRAFSGYVGLDLLFTSLVIVIMVVFAISTVNARTNAISGYFLSGQNTFSALVASDYVVKIGPGGENSPLAYHHIFRDLDRYSTFNGTKISGLDGYVAYLVPPANSNNSFCIARIVVIENTPEKIYVCNS